MYPMYPGMKNIPESAADVRQIFAALREAECVQLEKETARNIAADNDEPMPPYSELERVSRVLQLMASDMADLMSAVCKTEEKRRIFVPQILEWLELHVADLRKELPY